MKKSLLLALLTILMTGSVFSADIARGVRVGSNEPDTSNGGYFEAGFGLTYYQNPRATNLDNDPKREGGTLEIAINGAYRYKGFFIEAAQKSSDGLNLGYNFWNNENWSVDFLAASGSLIIGGDQYEERIADLEESVRDKKLVERDRPYQGTGLRATGYFDDYIVQFRLLTDTAKGNGVTSTARLGKSWQVKNWNFHGILSAKYASAKTNQYFFGVTAAQATSRFAEYNPDSAFSFSGEAGVTYPISEHWVFRSTVKLFGLSGEAKKSPLFDEKYGTFWSNTISYVF